MEIQLLDACVLPSPRNVHLVVTNFLEHMKAKSRPYILPKQDLL